LVRVTTQHQVTQLAYARHIRQASSRSIRFVGKSRLYQQFRKTLLAQIAYHLFAVDGPSSVYSVFNYVRMDVSTRVEKRIPNEV
jgi:hypothetical protein